MAAAHMPAPAPGIDERTRGLAFAFAAYGAWGFFPLYFKALGGLPALEILSHRIPWSAVFMAGYVAVTGRWRDVLAALRTPATVGLLAVTTSLIALNWGIYVWAVNAGRIVEASLGYFINPLVNVLLGALFLGETLSRPSRWAVGIATAGVLVLAVRVGTLPWIPLSVAASFGLYGLLRKRAEVDSTVGLLVEMLLLFPLAVGWLAWLQARGAGAFGGGVRITLLLMAGGVVTALPLVWFGIAVRRLRLATIGFVQYVTPTTQLLLAVWLYGERFTRAHAAAFGLIWLSLGIYTAEALWRLRRPAP
ncbi:MAG: EamA family transporter RarD [Anaeromyxobacteraceae bacterium]